MSTEQQRNALTEYNFVIVLDGSASMGEADMKGNRSRWEAMQESAGAFIRDVEAIDSDGLDVVLFNAGRVETFSGVTSAKTREIFAQRSPRGSTPMAEALSAALAASGSSSKKKFIAVITDGVPDDKEAVKNVIRTQANRQTTDDECTFFFMQIGYDQSAKQYLQQLDDNLGTKFDIVDAKTMEEVDQFASTTELILAAIAD